MGSFIYSLWLLMWISLELGSSSVTMTTKDKKANKQRFEAKNKNNCLSVYRVRPASVESSPAVAEACEIK